MESVQVNGRPVRLLDFDPDLAEDLEHDEFPKARAELIARSVTLGWTRQEGHWGPSEARGWLGVVVLEGVLLREVQLTRGGSAELLGAGDLLRPWDIDGEELLPQSHVCWTVLSRVTVALLDDQFGRRLSRWPSVAAQLTARSVLRAKSNTLNQAISHFKHVESRLLLVFWHFAQRWGKVGTDGVVIALPLTHELLGKLVGATRPSVTTALGQLAERGLLLRDENRWHLTAAAVESLDAPAPELAAGVSAT
jgi:CRP/FNR family transcriptional regulator, cyclic AMP receptor protein